MSTSSEPKIRTHTDVVRELACRGIPVCVGLLAGGAVIRPRPDSASDVYPRRKRTGVDAVDRYLELRPGTMSVNYPSPIGTRIADAALEDGRLLRLAHLRLKAGRGRYSRVFVPVEWTDSQARAWASACMGGASIGEAIHATRFDDLDRFPHRPTTAPKVEERRGVVSRVLAWIFRIFSEK